MTLGSTITVEQPSLELAAWCKENLTITNPEYAQKMRMHLWLGNTPRYLDLYETRGTTLILPFGVLRRVMQFIGDAAVQTDFSQGTAINYGCSVPLYDYQEEAVDAVIRNHFGILQSPAGSGKTQMGIAAVAKLGKRTLWLTHTKDLLTQSKSRAELYMDSALLGTITEGKVNIGEGITFATIQTMCRLDLSQYKHYWDVIIADECHRCSGTPTAMTQFSKVLNSLSARHKYGLSATVHRSDGTIAATYALLGEIIYTVPDAAVGDRIMKVAISPVGTGVPIHRKCLNTDGTLNYTKLISHLCETESRNHTITQFIVENRDHPSLILSDRLDHLRTLMAMLPADMQSMAVMVDGSMTSKKGKLAREQAIEDMRHGRKKYLFASYTLAKEGLDIPCLERLYLTTPKKDYAVITQSIGRIARTHPGKKEPVCFDFVDNIGYLIKTYKKRCATYRKLGCKII